LVAEHARLDALPLVALAGRRRGQEHADFRPFAERAEARESRHAPALATRPARVREEVRLTSVDDEVRLVGPDPVDNARLEVAPREPSVLERDVACAALDVAVTGVHEIEGGLPPLPLRSGDPRCELADARVERAGHRLARLACCHSVQTSRIF